MGYLAGGGEADTTAGDGAVIVGVAHGGDDCGENVALAGGAAVQLADEDADGR